MDPVSVFMFGVMLGQRLLKRNNGSRPPFPEQPPRKPAPAVTPPGGVSPPPSGRTTPASAPPPGGNGRRGWVPYDPPSPWAVQTAVSLLRELAHGERVVKREPGTGRAVQFRGHHAGNRRNVTAWRWVGSPFPSELLA